MKPGYAFTADESRTNHPDHDLWSRHVPGLSDEIGERLLILDDQNAPALELLRFRRALTTPGFEVALRRRVERLRQFRHPAFARTPAVEYLGQDRCLALLSSYTPGRRLSEVLAHAQDPALSVSLIGQLTPALDALNDYSDGIGHGALTASRILIAPEGQLIVVEHVLGSALERLHLTATAMHRDLGIPVPSTEAGYARLDGPTDCYQLALIAVSMLLGRRLRTHEYSDPAAALNAALPASASAEPIVALRTWLERALQINGRGFLSSGEASKALREASLESADDTAERWRALLEIVEEESQEESVDAAGSGDSDLVVLSQAPVEEPLQVEAPETLLADVPPEPIIVPAIAPAAVEPPIEPAVEAPAVETAARPMAVQSNSKSRARTRQSPGSRLLTYLPPPRDYVRWAAIALALCAIVEAAVIAVLLARRGTAPPPATVAQINLATADPGAQVMVDGQLAGVTPLDLTISPGTRSINVAGSQPAAPKPELVVGSTGSQNDPLEAGQERVGARPRTIQPAAPPPPRVGGIRLSSPIELEVFEGNTRLGSSATGIVSAPAGRHEFDLINSALGFRTRQVVDVKPGQTVALTVSPPNGRLNINAVPWAEVLVDGKPVGETPIGNLPIALGEHEIVFRHPQLGEVRRTALVRLDTVTRVSVNLER